MMKFGKRGLNLAANAAVTAAAKVGWEISKGVRMCVLDEISKGVRMCVLDEITKGVRMCVLDEITKGVRMCVLDEITKGEIQFDWGTADLYYGTCPSKKGLATPEGEAF